MAMAVEVEVVARTAGSGSVILLLPVDVGVRWAKKARPGQASETGEEGLKKRSAERCRKERKGGLLKTGLKALMLRCIVCKSTL